MDIQGEKKRLRSKMLDVRKKIGNRREKEKKIAARLVMLKEYKLAQTILLYASYNGEVETWAIIDHALQSGKEVALPRVNGREMEFYLIKGREDLESGTLGILEPKPTCTRVSFHRSCLVILPGLAFDRCGYRLGYGGGYYDRYLARHRVMGCIAIAYQEQIVDEVPYEITDFKMDMIVTDGGIINGFN